MKISAVTRVIISNALLDSAIVAFCFGYGPLPVIVAVVIHTYLHQFMTPRIPEFIHRGHPLMVLLVWYFLVIALVAGYFATISSLLSPNALLILASIVVPLLCGWSFFDDLRYARKLQKETKAVG